MVSMSRLSRPSRTRRSALALAAVGLASACGSGNAPGIAVTNAQSDVVFGNPASTPGPGSVIQQPGNTTFVPRGPGFGFGSGPTIPPLPGFTNKPYVFPTNNPGPVRSSFCPGPPLYASAPQAATTYVQDQPKPGFYFWQVIKSEERAPKVFFTTAKYTNHEIRNVSPITTTPNPQGDPTTTFSYDEVDPIAGGHTITYTYQVKQNAPGANVGQVSNVGQPRRVSVPDAGVAIKAEIERDADGKTVGKFQPSTAVLILPLPISGGAQFTGAGTDPTTGGSLQVSGTVIGPDRVSGCTNYVQGERVDASVTSSGTSGQAGPTVNETFVVATENGGLVVGNKQTPTNSKITISSIVGDASPSKTPKSIPKDLRL